MKSERRHDLQTNTLAKGIEKLPNVGREYGSKILLVITLVLLVAVAARWWLTNRATRAERVAASLTDSERLLSQMRDQQIWNPGYTAKQIDDARSNLRQQIESMVQDVLSNASDAAQQADAKLIRADLYWELGARSLPPEATTRPTTGPAAVDYLKPSEMLETAAREYATVLESSQSGSLPIETTARARFGLAAIAEERSDWATARTHYEAIANDPKAGEALRDQARWRRDALANLGKPVVLGHPFRPEAPTPTTDVAPSTTKPATMPTAMPAGETPAPVAIPTTLPAATLTPATSAPATMPATVPAQ